MNSKDIALVLIGIFLLAMFGLVALTLALGLGYFLGSYDFSSSNSSQPKISTVAQPARLTSFAKASSITNYAVNHSEHAGFTVIADNYVHILMPDNKTIQVTKIPFVSESPRFNIAPVSPIMCSWDPTDHWLVILIPVRQVTEIHVFDLRARKLIDCDPKFPSYPDWYRNVLSTYTSPINWIDDSLNLDTFVLFKDKVSGRHLSQSLIIESGIFHYVTKP